MWYYSITLQLFVWDIPIQLWEG